MHTSGCSDILIAYDRWATGVVLDACVPLASDRFCERFEMGPGSLHDTLVHIVAAMKLWTDSLAGRPREAVFGSDGVVRSVQEIRLAHDEWHALFEAEAERLPLDEPMTHTSGDGRAFSFSRGVVVAHVTTHGVHHRAQCLNMLRRVGVDPVPNTGLAMWARQG